MPELPHASGVESLRVFGTLVLPRLLRGLILARPRMDAALAPLDMARHSCRVLAALRERYRAPAVWVHGMGGDQLIVLDAGTVTRILDGPVETYAVDTEDKWAVVGPVQPDSLLLSRGEIRAERRPFNEAVLGYGRAAHPFADHFQDVLIKELAPLFANSAFPAASYFEAFARLARRFILGDAAADDAAITDAMRALRAEGNWLNRRRWRAERTRAIADQFTARLHRYADAARPDEKSLVASFASAPCGPHTAPVGQIPHWLMAFDLPPLLSLTALTLLAGDPARQERAATDAAFRRTCILEVLRLWPPVPLLARETTETADWDGWIVPAGSTVLVPTPFHGRDPATVSDPDRFVPERWDDGAEPDPPWYAPFSRGGAECAGRDLALTLTVAALGELLRGRRFDRTTARLDPKRALPYTIRVRDLQVRMRAGSSR
ncbi:cytochrome P450 [Nocardia sp. XZ_19_385]|uniref:cytochrome P450 n=1 Tax=Nocardia sp. XZ_19_385 TaxID=2769488 RepID=UPI00188E9315|nr:cytochrome P450 [Nocardia sp. XZ_19_385]